MDTCPQCGTSRSPDREYCPACGAPAVHTPQTMYDAWQAYRQRRTLGSSGAWNILWGVLIMGSGVIMLRESGLNALLLFIGLFLIGTGIAAWAAPGPLTLRLDASALLVVGVWNVVVSLANGLSGRLTWLVLGIVQIVGAIQRFRKHGDLERVQHVPPAVSQAVGALVKGTQRAHVDRETDVIDLRAEGKLWKARLMPGMVVAVTGKGAAQEVRFLPPGGVELQVSGEILERGWIAAEVRLGGGRWPGSVSPLTPERYAAWRATVAEEPGAEEEPVRRPAVPGTEKEPGRLATPGVAEPAVPAATSPRPEGRRVRRPALEIPVWVWLAAAIVIVLPVTVGGVFTYQLLGRRAFARSGAAYQAGNYRQACPELERIARVYGPFGGSYVRQVRKSYRECEVLAQADADRAQKAYEEAVQGYRRYLATYPAGVFVSYAQAGLEETYSEWSRRLVAQSRPLQALDMLSQVYAGYEGRPVPAAIEQAFVWALYGLASENGADGQAVIAASWEAICAGQPVPSQAVGLMIREPPRAWFVGDVALVPEERAATEPGNFRYAICLEEVREPIQSCRYVPARVVDRQQIQWRVEVRDTLTGQPLQVEVFGGGLPDACPDSWTFGANTQAHTLTGAPPDVGPVRVWVAAAINAPPPAVTIEIKPPMPEGGAAPPVFVVQETPVAYATPTAQPTPQATFTPQVKPGIQLELLVGHNRSGASEAALSDLADQYMAAHPEVRIFLNAVREQSSIEHRLDAGTIDILLWSMSYLPEWAAQGQIVPLAEADPAWMREEYIAPAAEAAMVGDQVYGLPASATTAALIYNRALVAGQDVPRTTDDLLARARAWNQTDTYLAYPIGMSFLSSGWFHGGQSWWADEACLPNLDTPDGLAAAEWIAALGRLVPEEADWDLLSELVQSGQAPLTVNGLWVLSSLEASGIDYGVAPLPALSATGREPAPYVEMSAWMIARRVALHGRLAEAWDLIAFLASAESQQAMARQSTYIPTVRAASAPGWFGGREDLAALYAQAARGVAVPSAACQARQSALLDGMIMDLRTGGDPAEVIGQTQAALVEAAGGE